MSRVIIICVESSKQAGFDDKNIDTIIKYYYGDKNPIRYVNMDGKGNYKKRNVKQSIDDKSIGFKEVIVVYAVDLDNFETKIAQQDLNDSIFAYCDRMKYQVIWFHPNIEYVLINKDVDKSQKRLTVSQFTKNNNIEWIDSSYLDATTIKRGYSNILQILDKYLHRKKQ